MMGFRDSAASSRMGWSEQGAVVGGGDWGSTAFLLSPICVPSRGQVLALALQAFLELMEHGMVSWEILSTHIVKKVGGISQTAVCMWGAFGIQLSTVGCRPPLCLF